MKIKSLLLVTFTFFLSMSLYAQEEVTKYVIKESNVHFFSEAPLEDIEADNADTKAVIDTESDSFSFRIPISSFIFEKALMQEHFNENYMESDKYPNGSFKGEIDGEYSLTEDGEYDVDAVGTLNIHGKDMDRRIPAIITVENGVPSINAKFDVKLEDHDIAIPKVVFYNIAEVIEVTIKASLEAYRK